MQQQHKRTNQQYKPVSGRGNTEKGQVNSQQNNTIFLLQRVISSNQDMLKEQTSQLRLYRQKINQKQEETEVYRKKYQLLLQSIQKNQQNPTEVLLDRIVEIQKQLIETKIDLAIKSGEVLEYQYKLNDQKNKSIKLIKEISQNDDSSQKSQQQKNTKYKNNSLSLQITKSTINEQFEVSQIKYQDIFEENRKKLSQQEQNHLMIWKKQLQQFSDIFSISVSNIDQIELFRFKEKTTHLLKRFVFIPHQLRLKIWPILIKNTLGISNSLYIQLLDHHKKGWISEKVKSQIQKDMIRSFNGRGTVQNLQKIKIDTSKNTFTINTNRIAEDATQILQIFHIYRPDIGYVQGMTYPTIILTLVVGKITAFTILVNLLVGNEFFRKLITFQPNFIAIFCRTFDKLAESIHPQISKHLKKLQISSQVYLVDWFFTFFSRGLSPKTILCIWDNIFYFEQLAMYRLSLTIIQLLQNNIMQNQYQSCILLIRQYYLNVDQKQLLNAFNNNKLTRQKYDKVFRGIQKSF